MMTINAKQRLRQITAAMQFLLRDKDPGPNAKAHLRNLADEYEQLAKAIHDTR